MADLNSPQGGNTDPNISTGTQSGRYPNVFFDLGQQYMPPTIKELFRWCTFYFYNSPLIGATITKISRYPITDLIIEDSRESVRDLWDTILNKDLVIKERLMEVNLDFHTYGNAFVSVHLPFTRFLICPACKDRVTIQHASWSFNTSAYSFNLNCKKCNQTVNAEVHDVPYKDRKGIRMIRWNPENIYVKYNEYTGRRMYMYSIPYKLKNSILRGDKDIIEDCPMVVIEALKSKRMIRFNNDNFRHLKRPTLAEQDQGWGKPLIIHVLKDMYYMYTLRRAQEAIAMEHIVPFDLIYPMPNAQQDPYVHTDLASWRTKIEVMIQKHRRDPNFKAVMPIPVGLGRLGGDGKAMLLTPELNYLTQTIITGMGVVPGFVMGDLNFTGSSIALRTMENDFIQNRSQLIDLVLWLKDKIRLWLTLPNVDSIRFSDFRMADDIQRNQQAIGLNAQNKISDQTLLTELGFDYDQEVKKMIEEVYLNNYLNDLRAKSQARTQGESQIIMSNYQQKIQELAAKAQASAQQSMVDMGYPKPNDQSAPQIQMGGQQDQGAQGNKKGWEQALPAPLDANGGGSQASPQMGQPGAVDAELQTRIKAWVNKIKQLSPGDAQATISELKAKMPDIGAAVEKEYNMAGAEVAAQGGGPSQQNAKSVQPNMNPLPEKGAPTRAGAI